MIWLTWRQFRAQALAAIGVLMAFAFVLAATEPRMTSELAASGLAGCQGPNCQYLAGNFLIGLGKGYPFVYLLGLAGVIFAPAVVGIFWGAPLIAGELETGTFAVAWTQSITRSRWLTVKLGTIGVVAMAVPEAVSAMLNWWATPISQASRFATGSALPFGLGPFSVAFDARGIVPVGYAAFALLLGVTAGLLIKRTLTAMAATLAIFVAVQVAVPKLIRPHLLRPDHTTLALGHSGGTISQHLTCGPGVPGGPAPGATIGCNPTAVDFAVSELPGDPGAWILSSEAVNASGHSVSAIPDECRQALGFPPGLLRNCMDSLGVRMAVTYQPSSRYWAIQWAETGFYLVLALALTTFCFMRVSRRLS